MARGLSSERLAERWLSSNDTVPHLVFFSDRKSTPPLLKALSLEFHGRAALGVVLAGAQASLAKRFRVTSRPALLHVLAEDTFEGEFFEKDFKKNPMTLFLSRAVAGHKSAAAAALRELTPSRLKAGDCAPSDTQFCLLLKPPMGDSGRRMKDALRRLARMLKTDPVKVFFVRDARFWGAFARDVGAAAPPGNLEGPVPVRRPRERLRRIHLDVPEEAAVLRLRLPALPVRAREREEEDGGAGEASRGLVS